MIETIHCSLRPLPRPELRPDRGRNRLAFALAAPLGAPAQPSHHRAPAGAQDALAAGGVENAG